VGPGRRKSQREATRLKVLDAARALFDSHGYEGTTIREIARRAEVSVGSVFTTFASKGDILSQVMQERLDGLYAELDRVVPLLRGSITDRLRTVLAIHFAYEARHARLFLAHIAAAFDWTLSDAARPFGRTPHLKAVMRRTLADGVARRDIDPAIDLDDAVELVLAAYAWTYRLAAWEGADAGAMTAVMDRQIGLIVDGLRPRSAP